MKCGRLPSLWHTLPTINTQRCSYFRLNSISLFIQSIFSTFDLFAVRMRRQKKEEKRLQSNCFSQSEQITVPFLQNQLVVGLFRFNLLLFSRCDSGFDMLRRAKKKSHGRRNTSRFDQWMTIACRKYSDWRTKKIFMKKTKIVANSIAQCPTVK